MNIASMNASIGTIDQFASSLQALQRNRESFFNSNFEGNFEYNLIRKTKDEILETKIAWSAMQEQTLAAKDSQARLNEEMRKSSAISINWQKQVDKVKISLGKVFSVKSAMMTADDLVNSKARLSSALLVYDDGGSVGEIEKKVMASAQRSRSGYLDAVSSVAKLGVEAKDTFSSMDEVIAFQELVNKQFVIGGASVQEQQAAMGLLTQAMASGVLRGEELNSIFDNAPGMIQNIADYMGVPIERIRPMADEGLITADIIKNAMFAASDEIESKFDSMPMTWSQVWNNVCNKALQITRPLLNAINLLANNMDILGPIVLGVAGVLGLYTAAVATNTVMQEIKAAKETLATIAAVAHGAAITENMIATTGMTKAQLAFNASLYACPLVWIIGIVIALVALFYAGIAVINKFAGTSISATGAICGAFMVVLAVICNVFSALWQTIASIFVAIWNIIADFVNFFGNVFTDPIGAVCRLFFDLVDTVLNLLQSLASAIDAILGSHLADAVQGWRDKLGGWVDDTFGEGKEFAVKLDAADFDLGRFEYGKAWDTGYKFGEGIGANLKNSLDFGLNMDSLYNSSAQTAENTAAMANSMEMSEEDLQYMRDIAEREAINRFTTAEVKVDMTGMTNRIDSNMDLDGVLTTLTDGFAEALEVAAEGVHV